MVAVDNPMLTRAFATLRMMGRDLDPGRISRSLEIAPSRAHQRGEIHGVHGQPWQAGLWSLSTEGRPIPTDLEPHVAWLLDQIEPVGQKFLALRAGGADADVFCFLESRYGHGGPEFSPHLLGRLAGLDLRLGLDCYFATEEYEPGADATVLQ